MNTIPLIFMALLGWGGLIYVWNQDPTETPKQDCSEYITKLKQFERVTGIKTLDSNRGIHNDR